MKIFNKLKNIVDTNNTDEEFNDVFEKSLAEQKTISNYCYSVKFSDIPTYTEIVKKWTHSKKAQFIIFLCKIVRQTNANEFFNEFHDKNIMANEYIQTLFKSKMKLSEEEITSIYSAFIKYNPRKNRPIIYSWPISNYFKQIEFNYQNKELPDSIKNIIEELINMDKEKNTYYYKDQIKLLERIKTFLYESSNIENKTQPTYFIGKDGFTDFANQLIDDQNDLDRDLWYKLMAIALKSTGSKPTQKFLKDTNLIIDELGTEKFKKVTQQWFGFVIELKETVETHRYESSDYYYDTIEFLDSLNSDAIKGFVWMSSRFYDNNTIQTISRLAEKCFRKIPGKGPAAASIGNACLFTLHLSKGLDGIAQLSKLKTKIKQNTTIALIEKYINESAKKIGVTPTEIEDLAVDDFKLEDFKITQSFGEFSCVLELTAIGKSTLRWFKKDGSEQKTVPQLVKNKFADKLKKLKNTQKQINQTTSVQKERFDRMLRSNRKMKLDYFTEKYINHGLLSFVIDKLIFSFSNGEESKTAIYINKQWIDLNYKQVDIKKYTEVSLWHPVNSSTNEVKEWRQFLIDSQIQQGFKQAFREIYLLTDAEINTRTYSNRMASHILKQHQYVSLAKVRNWKATLLGSWDSPNDDITKLYLPEYNLIVEYWVNALTDDDQYNDVGIWNYVITDQIRFINAETEELIELVDVPPIAFSEAMRDVDLFVGVASVGNDPNWTDSGGQPAYRNYWESYSFGNLSEIAKNRKEILEGLIPKLKIASVTSIEDKFVVVKGKIRTYKIHIGSTNILMEPNDQYLCIVPDKSLKNGTQNIFLPFDGDNGLSVIISKAFLLANDDKISDTTITSQINR